MQFTKDKVRVQLDKISYDVSIYDTDLASRWLEALEDNLRTKRILEKNFCFIGFAGSKRNLSYLVDQLNQSIDQINSFQFTDPYPRIHNFVTDDFQYSDLLPIGNDLPGLSLKHEACNLLHRYFEDLQGTVWKLSPYYQEADAKTKYSIRQLNNLCHEIEGWVSAHRKQNYAPEWVRPSQITTFLNAPRYNLHQEDFELFKQNRYDRELGGVYLHWSQIGKTLYEVWRDEDGADLDEATCSAISHQKYYSGEFDVEWGQTVTESNQNFKKEEMEPYRHWLARNGYDWNDPKLALGYIKIGQVDLVKSFGTDQFIPIYNAMTENLNIKKISTENVSCEFKYTLESDDWKEIQTVSYTHLTLPTNREV